MLTSYTSSWCHKFPAYLHYNLYCAPNRNITTKLTSTEDDDRGEGAVELKDEEEEVGSGNNLSRRVPQYISDANTTIFDIFHIDP